MIGETKVGGLWACNGFSGHGFKLAPAVGSPVAQQVTGLKTDAWETSVAHDFMGPPRPSRSRSRRTSRSASSYQRACLSCSARVAVGTRALHLLHVCQPPRRQDSTSWAGRSGA